MSYRNLISASAGMTPEQRATVTEERDSRLAEVKRWKKNLHRFDRMGDEHWHTPSYLIALSRMDAARTAVQRLDQYLDECDPTLNTTHHQDTP